MLPPWNDASILPPPIQTVSHKSENDINGLIHVTQNIVKVLNKQSPLHQESFLMARFLYKFDKKFRSDIGYRNFKKVNTALKKFFKINFLKEVQYFVNSMPQTHDDLYLPSRQMLEYLLVKMQTFSKILLRICVCSKTAAVFYLNRVKRGESHWMSLMPYALLSRVWSLCLVLLRHSFNWYTQLHKYLIKLNSKGLPFLPDSYDLPVDLEKWLEFQNFEDLGRIDWTDRKKLDIKINLIEEDDSSDYNSFQDILDYVREINDASKTNTLITNKVLKSDNEDTIKTINFKVDDCGEVVSRDSFKVSKDGQKYDDKKPIERKWQHSASAVTNKLSLLKFVDTEESLRVTHSASALTLHLSFMQWHALKKSLMNLYETLSSNRKIQKKFLRLWQDKCLVYSE